MVKRINYDDLAALYINQGVYIEELKKTHEDILFTYKGKINYISDINNQMYDAVISHIENSKFTTLEDTIKQLNDLKEKIIKMRNGLY